MRIEINGTVRDVANSAWISTIDDVNANSRSDDEVNRVTEFLAKNFHTSPFECISLTYFWKDLPSECISKLLGSNYSRYKISDSTDKESHLTIDLWNFIKVGLKEVGEDFYNTEAWKLFSGADPGLARKAGMFNFSSQKFDKTPDANDSLGDTNMRVELISIHDTGTKSTSRATWRVKCPLSIATQILRHRTGSFNQVSGRYRTVRNEFINNFDDISKILNKISSKDYYSEYTSTIFSNIIKYEELMLLAKTSKKAGSISNDEYKRLREVARYILPEGRMTELYVTFYLDDFDNYLSLRDSTHAQVEHIWVAQAMRSELNKKLDNK
jgi:flavin-dependent thymidylate synthase